MNTSKSSKRYITSLGFIDASNMQVTGHNITSQFYTIRGMYIYRDLILNKYILTKQLVGVC